MDYNQDPTKHTDTFGSGKHGFGEEVGARSIIRSSHVNALFREILAAIEGGSMVPSGADNTQLAQVLAAIRLTANNADTEISNLITGLGSTATTDLDQIFRSFRIDRLAHAITQTTDVSDVLSSSHNWHAGAISDGSTDPSVAYPRYWVAGDNGSGDTAIAYANAHDVPGANWASGGGSSQAGSLTKLAATGTYAMGVQTASGVWRLGGSSTANGTLGGGNFTDVVYDATNNLWVAATSGGIYTSPKTAIAWTQRQAGSFLCVGYYGGRLVAATASGVYYSTNGTSWTAGATTTWGSSTPATIAANSQGFWIETAANALYFTATGASLAAVTTPINVSESFIWNDIFCTGGVHMSANPTHGKYRGVSGSLFGLGAANARMWGGNHGALMTHGTQDVVVMGPTIRMDALTDAT